MTEAQRGKHGGGFERQVSDPDSPCVFGAADLDALTQGAVFVVGHNVLRHDLLVLRRHFPKLRLHALPIVDTLLLSPIAFPQTPMSPSDKRLQTGS